MNPVKLKFRHGGEMLVSPIGLRFVPDPEHGTLVLIPDAQGPRGYQLDMTLEEAEQAFRSDQTQVDAIAKKVYWLQEQLEKAEKGWTTHEERLNRIERALHQHYDRWRALRIHLGLPEGWESLHEGAAEVKGALVSQAEQLDELEGAIFESSFGLLARMDRKAKLLDSLKAHVDALYSELGLNSRWEGEKLVSYRDTDSILTEVVLMQAEVSRLTEESSLFTVAKRVGELEEAHQRLRERTENLESWKREVHPDLAQDRAFPLLDDRTCVQRPRIYPGPEGTYSSSRQTWTAPQMGEPSSAMFDRLRAAEKPKSAWKPLSECLGYGAFLLKRVVGQTGIILHASRGFHGWTFVSSQNRSGDAWKPNQYPEHYEFCPIPE